MPLPKPQFNNIIRVVRHGSLDNVTAVRTATFYALKRLGVARNTEKAVAKTPKGSDQVNIGSFVTWTQKLKSSDDEGVRQLVAIDATAVLRS